MALDLGSKAARPGRAATPLETLEAQMNAAVAEIQSADRKTLLVRWQEYYGRQAPSHMREDLLRRALAHEAQMRLAGASARAVKRRVEKLVAARAEGKRTAATVTAKVAPGARLIREWGGEIHQVTTLDKGFVYRGKTYLSLSEIARTITGARWSGPLFFGLRTVRNG